MSFSSNVKEELSKINNLAKKEEVRFELLGYLISKNTTVFNNNYLRYATESEYNINRLAKLLKNLLIDYKIEFDGKSFIIIIKLKNFQKDDINSLFNIIDKKIQIQDIKQLQDFEKRAIIRGAFLGAGSINNPENKYHLEINLSNEINLNKLLEILTSFGLNMKKLNQKNKTSIYLKEGEEISNILALIGANKAVLEFEDIRVKRDMRGKVNRIVNCKTANLNKTINASVEQIEAIKKLQKLKKFNKMDENLKEIAILRIENPEMSLVELGKRLSTPLGKSGVNYRLKKIIDIANEI